MRFQRRQLLRTLSFAFGSSFIWSRNQLGIAAQTAIQPKVSPPPAGPTVREGIKNTERKQVYSRKVAVNSKTLSKACLWSKFQERLGWLRIRRAGRAESVEANRKRATENR